MKKGIISMPNFDFETIDVPAMKVLASICPGCTINAVKASKVVGKYRLQVPQRIYNLPNISCNNRFCVSSPENKQRDVVAFFERVPFYETSVLPDCKGPSGCLCASTASGHIAMKIFGQTVVLGASKPFDALLLL